MPCPKCVPAVIAGKTSSENPIIFEEEEPLSICKNIRHCPTATMHSYTHLPSAGVKIRPRILTAGRHYHESSLGSGENQRRGLGEIRQTTHFTPRVVNC